jgi:hypothetical protein
MAALVHDGAHCYVLRVKNKIVFQNLDEVEALLLHKKAPEYVAKTVGKHRRPNLIPVAEAPRTHFPKAYLDTLVQHDETGLC